VESIWILLPVLEGAGLCCCRQCCVNAQQTRIECQLIFENKFRSHRKACQRNYIIPRRSCKLALEGVVLHVCEEGEVVAILCFCISCPFAAAVWNVNKTVIQPRCAYWMIVWRRSHYLIRSLSYKICSVIPRRCQWVVADRLLDLDGLSKAILWFQQRVLRIHVVDLDLQIEHRRIKRERRCSVPLRVGQRVRLALQLRGAGDRVIDLQEV